MNSDPSILIWHTEAKISIVSMYIDNFLLVSNIMATLKALKVSLAKEYDTKDLRKVKTIIRWQIHRDLAADTMKIDQSAFVQDLVIKEGLTHCNANIIPIKAGLSIEMPDPEDYKEADLCIYQRII